jgi:Asp-tRNA(Asn)/Glu-tRNA(Gln) amidotransferase A subunit family amidase
MSHPTDRRQLLRSIAACGVGTAVFHRALAAQAQTTAKVGEITAEMVQQAEWISGITLNDDDRKSLARKLSQTLRGFEQMRKIPLSNDVAPAITFQPSLGLPPSSTSRGNAVFAPGDVKRPATEEDLAYLGVAGLGELIRTKKLTSVELTKICLKRLKKADETLKCVVTLTEELALKQAAAADAETAAGKSRGPLHGIPWGAKDLIAYPGYKTTWGATPYKDQTLDTKASVAARLDAAGAVLVAKLTLGALAQGDMWFGGMTRNPWNPKQGSSGSSAGSASAVAAGLVPFAIGSETLGSIVSPCTRCGATGLRPTFGRVGRAGCMALSWTMDKLGPICRSIEDCAIVFSAIHGADGIDSASVDRPFDWPLAGDLKKLRVGYVETKKEREEIAVLREIGVQLVPIKLPDTYPVGAMITILTVECASAFDDITRKGITEGLNTWPATFREGQFVPAVEYLRANRLRTLLMQEMAKVFEKVDLYVGGNDLLITNLTGHPSTVMPNGFTKTGDTETPRAITFTGKLFGETELLAVSHAYQKATGHHIKRPPG